jgi:hypothetical protein
MCFVCAWKIGLFIRLMLFWLSQCNCVRLSFKSWSSSNKVQNQEISLAPSKNDLYSTSILHKANVGWSLLVQDKVWWKEGVDEALHGWSKHHQQLKFAKKQLLAIACDVKPEVIFCGICVHDICFLTYYENGDYSLLTAPAMWWCALHGCIFCVMVVFLLKLWLVYRAMDLNGIKRVQLV